MQRQRCALQVELEKLKKEENPQVKTLQVNLCIIFGGGGVLVQKQRYTLQVGLDKRKKEENPQVKVLQVNIYIILFKRSKRNLKFKAGNV